MYVLLLDKYYKHGRDMWEGNIRDFTMICNSPHVVDKNIMVSLFDINIITPSFVLLFVLRVMEHLHYLQCLYIENSPQDIFISSLSLLNYS